jgi:hypothetical protein
MHEEDLKVMKMFDEIVEKDLRKEVKKVTDAGTITPTDVKTITDALCLMLKSKEYESWLDDEGYSERSYAPARSHTTGRYMSRGMDPYSYYASDRYPSHNRMVYEHGFSGHSTRDRMVARLEDMMGEAKNDYEANMIREAINRIQEG